MKLADDRVAVFVIANIVAYEVNLLISLADFHLVSTYELDGQESQQIVAPFALEFSILMEVSLCLGTEKDALQWRQLLVTKRTAKKRNCMHAVVHWFQHFVIVTFWGLNNRALCPF